MALTIYNTLSREKEVFVPLEPGKVRVYDCGPTVWAEQHIGNLYRYVVSDVVRRTFEYLGYEVRQVMNITDVGAILGDVEDGEDRMSIAARREGLGPLAVAEKYTALFFADEERLNVERPHVISKATEHVPEMLLLIQKLIDRGHAYVAADGVYFDVSSWPRYGELSKKPLDELIAGARIEVNPNKRNPADFALWRGAKPEDLLLWPSPWGEGKPGWHIECSAMSMKYLGETFDIHSGGEDHVFPHHECELAQSVAATGKPFARYWMHVHFLLVDGRAMHKSIGNVVTVSDIVARGFDPLAFRLLGLQAHYRARVNFTWESLAQQQERLTRWRSNVKRLHEDAAPAAEGSVDDLREAFRAAIEDDFNMAEALAVVEETLHQANSTPDAEEKRLLLDFVFEMDRVLGLRLAEAATRADTLAEDEARLLRERDAARAAREWQRADAIRLELVERGIRLHDTKDGTRWERVPMTVKR